MDIINKFKNDEGEINIKTILIILGIIIAIIVFGYDEITKTLFPKYYWSERAEKFRQGLENNEMRSDYYKKTLGSDYKESGLKEEYDETIRGQRKEYNKSMKEYMKHR